MNENPNKISDILLKKEIYERCMSHVELSKVAVQHFVDDPNTVDITENYIALVPDEFLPAFSIVSAAFPELSEESITLKFRSFGMTMQARPNIWKMFAGRREYFIFVNTERRRNGLILSDLPIEAQVGVIAHEMCHILDYHFKTNWQIFKTGLWYLKKRNQEDYEKAVDYLVIKKGLGSQLKAWSHHVLHVAPLTVKYKKTKEKYYLNPEEIHNCMGH